MTYIYYLIVSVGQELASGLDAWFWLKVFYRDVVKMLAGATVIWTSKGDSLTWLLAGGHSSLLTAGHWPPQIFDM